MHTDNSTDLVFEAPYNPETEPAPAVEADTEQSAMVALRDPFSVQD